MQLSVPGQSEEAELSRTVLYLHVTTDPDQFTLRIVAEVMEMYLQPGKQYGDRERFGFLSPLGEVFAKHGLGTPDCAVFWDFCVCA